MQLFGGGCKGASAEEVGNWIGRPLFHNFNPLSLSSICFQKFSHKKYTKFQLRFHNFNPLTLSSIYFQKYTKINFSLNHCHSCSMFPEKYIFVFKHFNRCTIIAIFVSKNIIRQFSIKISTANLEPKILPAWKDYQSDFFTKYFKITINAQCSVIWFKMGKIVVGINGIKWK